MEEEIKEQPIFSVGEETEKEPIVISDETKRTRRKQRGDDIMVTQCLLCMILVLSIFSLHWINPEFQSDLLSQYEEKLHAPAEAFIAQLLEKIESWVH